MDVEKHFLSRQPEQLGICQQKPKYPQYSLLSKRQESFSTWPVNANVKSTDLAECGFVYTGVADSVRCYHCGGGLRNWDEGDSPWVEHITWYPDCPHVKLVQGQGFVDRIKNSKPLESDEPLFMETQSQQTLPAQNDLIDSIPALSCIQMGCAKDDVQKAIQKYLKLNGNLNFKGEDLYRIILEEEDDAKVTDSGVETDGAGDVRVAANVTDSAESALNENDDDDSDEDDCDDGDNDGDRQESFEELFEENCRLKDNQRCKICMEGTASVIFLPCGHMVTCPQCAPVFTKCPICRKSIHGIVKAYFATS